MKISLIPLTCRLSSSFPISWKRTTIAIKNLRRPSFSGGSPHYKIHHVNYSLTEGQIIIVDSSDLHRIFHSSDDALMLTIQVDLAYFSNTYPAFDSSIFVCEIPDVKDPHEYQEL